MSPPCYQPCRNVSRNWACSAGKHTTHQPEATPGAVAAALSGYPLGAVEAGHGFCCWLCYRDRPDWQGMSLLVAGEPHQQWVRQGAGQPPAGIGSQAQPCCTGQRGEFMGDHVRICVPQPQAAKALLEAKDMFCLSCHSWGTTPAAAAGPLSHLPAQPGQGLCMSGMQDLASLRGSKHCLLFLAGGRSRQGSSPCFAASKRSQGRCHSGVEWELGESSSPPHSPKGTSSTRLTHAVTVLITSSLLAGHAEQGVSSHTQAGRMKMSLKPVALSEMP